jgi:hypothetical protein
MRIITQTAGRSVSFERNGLRRSGAVRPPDLCEVLDLLGYFEV